MPRSNNARAVKKAISLPQDLARFATTTARDKGILTDRDLNRYLTRKPRTR